jgi:hypothetical protein
LRTNAYNWQVGLLHILELLGRGKLTVWILENISSFTILRTSKNLDTIIAHVILGELSLSLFRVMLSLY